MPKAQKKSPGPVNPGKAQPAKKPAQPTKKAAAAAKDAQSTKAEPAVPVVVKEKQEKGPAAALLIVGAYHSVACGFSLRGGARATTAPPAVKFSAKCHNGAVTTVAACSRFVVTAGSDERMRIFTVKARAVTDLGTVCPASQLNCAAFVDTRFLIGGCEDGTVCFYRTKDWDCAAALPVHERAVRGVAVHPLGSLAVTVADDRFVAVLDLERARVVTKAKLPARTTPHGVQFSTDAACFAVFAPYRVTVFDTATAAQRSEAVIAVDPPREIHSALFVSPRHVLLGHENGAISLATLDGETVALSDLCPEAHTARVRSMVRIPGNRVVSLDSTGAARVWALSTSDAVALQPQQSFANGARITCAAALQFE